MKVPRDPRDRDRFLESIIENVPDMIFLKDAKELRFVRFNRAGEELLGYPREDLLGKNDYDLFPKEQADFFTAADRSVLESGTLLDIPAEPIHTRLRGLRWLHTKKIPIRDEDGEPLYLLGISEDITEKKEAEEARKRAEDELVKSAKELSRSNAELSEFAYVASHDLQEPLRKIQAFSELLSGTASSVLNAEGLDYLERIFAAAVRMRALIQDLLNLSRVTSKGRAFAAVDLQKVVREVIVDLEIPIKETGATIDFLGLPHITADLVQMRQLFQNLIGNAIKFRKDGVAPHIVISSEPFEAGVRVSVADNGIGLAARHAEKIFKPFQRLHGAGQYPGTGIGLAICKKIVERHAGTLTVESELNAGATFVITLGSASVAIL